MAGDLFVTVSGRVESVLLSWGFPLPARQVEGNGHCDISSATVVLLPNLSRSQKMVEEETGPPRHEEESEERKAVILHS